MSHQYTEPPVSFWVFQREWCSASFHQFTAAKRNRSKTECTARKSTDHTLPFQKLPRRLFIKVYFDAPETLILSTVLQSFYHKCSLFYTMKTTPFIGTGNGNTVFHSSGINKKIATQNLPIVPTYDNVFVRAVLKKIFFQLAKETQKKKNPEQNKTKQTRNQLSVTD